MEWVEFLLWFKQRTETAWSNITPLDFDPSRKGKILGRSWQKDTRWIGGYSEDEITAVEQKWAIKFPADYRRFLALLGSPDRNMIGTGWQDDQIVQVESPSFYNWQTETEEIINALNWPLEGLGFDVEHNAFWLDSWGAKPDTEDGRFQVVQQLVSQAPALIPIIGHRYLVDYPINGANPVLSVYQSDIIVYGTNLRTFLLRETADLLDIPMEKDSLAMVEDYYKKYVSAVPFWGEIMLDDLPAN
jgi:hypothetical protein